jgi:hypothetical protein
VSDNPRRIDEDLMLVDSIRDLEPAHLRLLEELDRPADPSNLEVEWGQERIAAVMGNSLSAVGRHAALGGLLRRGLVRPVSGFSSGGYRITEFGSALLEVLRLSKPS